ncbi:MAG TPA: mycofactocin biosynthesis glycosyltransferase MftF [Acidimicrobiales bacterium]|nr:mycofactocin biosynthesis glycosyltransferase MftF [Acidimicrobiales bacterium]
MTGGARAPVPAPGTLGVDERAGLPLGFGVALDGDTRHLTPDTLWGGSPARALRLSPTGVDALVELEAGTVRTAAGAVLARKLVDGNLAAPLPPPAAPALEYTVVIPVRDRPAALDRCLGALASATATEVVVVDDGSTDPEATATVCRRHGARLLRHPHPRGPGPARNTGLAAVRTPLVAFVDSDCDPPPGWPTALLGHFADPLVAAVAARVVPLPAPGGRARRYWESTSSLDLGDRPATVAPGTRVAYVPTANLIARTAALGGGFDEALPVGEDVDLVWRLVEAGWRVRYDPAVEVAHDEPAGQPALLRRRFRYGRSAAPLARRHPGSVPPLVLSPWPALAVGAVAAGRPLAGLAAHAASTALLASRLRRAGLPTTGVIGASGTASVMTWSGVGRWITQFAAPAFFPLLFGQKSRRRRLAAFALLAAPPLLEWRNRRPPIDPVTFAALRIADDVAYGLGVWRGCLAERRIDAMVPGVTRSFLSRRERDVRLAL